MELRGRGMVWKARGRCGGRPHSGKASRPQARVSRSFLCDLRHVLTFSEPGFLLCKLGLVVTLLEVIILVCHGPGIGSVFGKQHCSRHALFSGQKSFLPSMQALLGVDRLKLT